MFNKITITILASIMIVGVLSFSNSYAVSDNAQKIRIDLVGGISSHIPYFYEVSAKSQIINAGSHDGLRLFTNVVVTDLDGNPLVSFDGITPLEKRPNYTPDEDGFVKLQRHGIPFVYDGIPFCGDGLVTINSHLISASGKILPGGDSSTAIRWISASGGCGF